MKINNKNPGLHFIRGGSKLKQNPQWEKFGKWCLNCDLPRMGFIIGLVGDLVSSSITVGGIVNGNTISPSSSKEEAIGQQKGAIGNEGAKLICNTLLLVIYEILQRLIGFSVSKIAPTLEAKAKKAIREFVSLIVVSLGVNDGFVPALIKPSIVKYIANSQIVQNILCLNPNNNTGSVKLA